MADSSFPLSLVLFAAIIAFNLAFRSNHDRSECLKPIFRVINVVWPWFAALMPPLGGVLLLLDIFLERAFFEEKEFDIELASWKEDIFSKGAHREAYSSCNFSAGGMAYIYMCVYVCVTPCT